MKAGGALVGWRWQKTEHGVMLRLQIAPSLADYRARNLQTTDVTLNDRQLRSLARDLTRAVSSRGMTVFAPATRWQLLRQWLLRR